MCSGTDAPILALEMIRDFTRDHTPTTFNIDHAYSAEVDPSKQAFLEKTYQPPVIFRDVVELIEAMKDETPMATNAYGAKVPIRTDIDILMAGTSCKDFSALNKNKKTLSDDGESAATWEGVKAYAAVAKPTIVIVENVYKAPWDRMRAEYEEIGYEAAGVRVDAKNFYLPQTRQRGYMVCFNRDRMQEVGLTSLATKWQTLMGDLQRHASSDVSSFLLPKDRVSAIEHVRADGTKQDRDWVACAERHVRYREVMRLGNSQPVTHWQESGSARVPEEGSASWYNIQTERVWDVLDCSVLRKALHMYDPRFKTRVVDVSQNIDRNMEPSAPGIVGCITPDGAFFIMDAGRVMAPEELLNLQGIPPEKIMLTTETPGEMQDLAGNAMTSTIAGAALLSALIVGYKLLKTTTMTVPASSPSKSRPSVNAALNTTSTEVSPADNISTLDPLLDISRRTARRCLCEGGSSTTKKDIQRCFDCGHTTCISCGGDPEHNYHHDQSLSWGRISPQYAEAEIRSKLPLCIKFGSAKGTLRALRRSLQGSKGLVQYVDLVEETVKHTFVMQTFQRRQQVTIRYRSQSSQDHLDLVLDDDYAEWQLFVHTPAHLPGKDPLRQALQQPVAKARASKYLFGEALKWRVPLQNNFSATITGHGGEVPIWQARMEMPDFRTHTQPRILTVTLAADASEHIKTSLEGTYEYFPRCGTACESLYKKLNDDASLPPLFLFLDQARMGEPKEDSFIFAKDPERLDYDEVRSKVTIIDSAWRPWSHGQRQCTVSIHADAASVEIAGEAALKPLQSTLKLQQPENFDEFLSHDYDCHQATELLSCGTSKSTHPSQPIALDDVDFFAQNSWLFEIMRRKVNSDGWHSFDHPAADGTCHSCAPKKPRHQWRLAADNDTILPYEEPRSAARYERAIKQLQPAIVIDAMFYDSNSNNASQVRLGANLVSMAHRVRARLPPSAHNVSFSWKLNTEFNPSGHFSLEKFNLKSIKNVDPFEGNLQMSVELFPNQSRAVEWMRKQEMGDGCQYVLEASEEERIQTLGWSLGMRAQMPVHVRGGIEASHPGFGKTISSLALVQAQLLEQGTKNIIGELSQRNAEPRLRVSAATLVICPRTLVDQWQDEAHEKLGLKVGADVFTIKTVHDLNKKSLDDFSNAKLIIVSSSVLRSDLYTERLAAFVAQPGPAADKGRVFEKWHNMALDIVPSQLEVLQGLGLDSFRSYAQAQYKLNINSDDLKVDIPSRRMRGKDYVAASKAKSKTNIVKSAASASLDTSILGSPLLEMFYFNRVICDEFHDYGSRDFAIVKAIKKDKVWGLSGTPAMGDFYDVSKMAALLGIPLPVGSDSRGVMKPSNIREYRKEKTTFERFNEIRQTCSTLELDRLQEKYQQFLDTFVTRNVTDYPMMYDDHLKPVTLDLVHQALYKEASQHLNSIEMRLKSGNKSKSTDREKRLNGASASADTAEEVLSKMTVFLDLEEIAAPSMSSTLSRLIHRRLRDVNTRETDIQEAIRKAEKEERVPFTQWRQGRLHFDVLGDEETVNAVKACCKSHDEENASTASTVLPDKTDRSQSGKINTMVNGLLVAKRSLRYVQNIQRVQQAAAQATLKKLCSTANCNSEIHDTDIGVSAFCGHSICRSCFEQMRDKADKQCPASGCRASIHGHHLLWKSKMGDLKCSKQSSHGAKIEAAVQVLQDIRKQGDQAILFVQYEAQLRQVGQALEHHGIAATVVDQVVTATNKIASFKDKAKGITAIVLNASDETATGLNLQNANHVIFLSPLLRDQQYAYDATMAQAIGRVRRHGQRKPIYVYRILALDTIDVDILEHRERGNTALTELGTPPIVPPSPIVRGSVGGDVPTERKQLVQKNGVFSLRPQSWLVRCGADESEEEMEKMRIGRGGGKRGNEIRTKVKGRIMGWEDFSSLIKFSRTFTEDDE